MLVYDYFVIKDLNNVRSNKYTCFKIQKSALRSSDKNGNSLIKFPQRSILHFAAYKQITMSSTISTGSGPPPPPRTKRPPHLAAAGGAGDAMTIQQRGPLGSMVQLPQQSNNKIPMHHATEGLSVDHLSPIAGSGVNVSP
jgi:hypothetical protein